MSVDVTITAAKAKAARFASSFKTEYGPAGVSKTRREKPLLTDRQYQTINEFAMNHIPAEQRDQFCRSVISRLSGCPADFAVRAAVVAAAVEHGFTVPQLRALGFDLRNEQKYIGLGSKELQKGAIA